MKHQLLTLSIACVLLPSCGKREPGVQEAAAGEGAAREEEPTKQQWKHYRLTRRQAKGADIQIESIGWRMNHAASQSVKEKGEKDLKELRPKRDKLHEEAAMLKESLRAKLSPARRELFDQEEAAFLADTESVMDLMRGNDKGFGLPSREEARIMELLMQKRIAAGKDLEALQEQLVPDLSPE